MRLFTIFILLFLVSCNSSGNYSAFSSKNISKNYKIGDPYNIKGKRYYPKEDLNYSETGIASWYGPNFHAKQTANGERYNQYAMTAAHRTLPLPTVVKVTNLENGRSVIVRINDRGPFAKNRIIDLSYGAAKKLGMIKQGTAKVKVEKLRQETARYIVKNNIRLPHNSRMSRYITANKPNTIRQNQGRLASYNSNSYSSRKTNSNSALTNSMNSLILGLSKSMPDLKSMSDIYQDTSTKREAFTELIRNSVANSDSLSYKILSK